MQPRNFAVTAILLLGFSISGFAQAQAALDEEQQKMRLRLTQGLESGELNAAEHDRLADRLAAISRKISAAMADGVMSETERLEIKLVQQKLSNSIYKQKHDAQSAGPRERYQVRRINQGQRIENGSKDGSLTPAELEELRLRKQIVQQKIIRAKQDGVVTDQEKARLEKAQDGLSREIREERHDAEATAR